MSPESSRPEAAFVLLMMQATFWFAAGISGLPFVLGGEVYMLVLAAASAGLAAIAIALAVGLIRRSRAARRWTLVLESLCVVGSLALLVLPIGANRGPVAVLVNLVLPAAIVVLVRGRRMRAQFGISAPPQR